MLDPNSECHWRDPSINWEQDGRLDPEFYLTLKNTVNRDGETILTFTLYKKDALRSSLCKP